MKLTRTFATLALALLAGTAFAATPASSDPATPAAKAAPAKAKALHCKQGYTAVSGKCEKKPKA